MVFTDNYDMAPQDILERNYWFHFHVHVAKLNDNESALHSSETFSQIHMQAH